MVPRTRLFVGNCEAKCMIKIFRGGRGGDTFETPSPLNIFCLYPPPVLRCFWKDPLMTPHPHHPTSSTFHCYPLPIHHPFPPKHFDHALSEAFAVWNSFCSWAQLGLVWLHSIRCEMDFNDLLSKGLVKFGRVWHLI